MRTVLIVAAFIAATANTGWANEMLRIKLVMDEFGNGTASVETTVEQLEKATEFEDNVVKSSRLPKTTILKNKDGLVRLLHNFADPDEFDVLFAGWPGVPNANARFDRRFQCLLMTSAEGDDAVVTYSYRTTPPFTVACDRYPMSRNSTLRLLMINDSVGMLGVVVSTGKRGNEIPAGRANLTVNWVDVKNGQQGQRRALVQPVEFTLADGVERKFRLPLPNVKIEDAFRLNMRANSSPQQVPHEIAGLLVQGRVSPLFGIVFDERRGVVFVKGWVKGSIAETSGLQVGDVIRTINGTSPDGLAHAVKLVGDTVVGDTLTLEVERAGKTSTVSIQSE